MTTVKYKGKIITDYTHNERQQMSSEERRDLRKATRSVLRERGYYDNVREMSPGKPLNPDDPHDRELGKGIGVY